MLEIFKVIQKILLDPINFFSDLKKQSVWNIYKYWVQLSLISTLVGFLLSIFNFSSWENLIQIVSTYIGPISPLLSVSGVFAFNVLLYLMIFVLSITIAFLFHLIIALIFHVFVYIFGGRGFEKTLAASIISMTPMMIFNSIPVLSFLAMMYSFVLILVGISKLHKLSIVKSILIVLLPGMLMFFFLFVLMVIFYASILPVAI